MADAGIPGSCSSARMACAFCRKRKLRCDRQMPKCNSCQRFGYDCEYGPLKGQAKRDQRVNSNPSHVRRLEDRLGRVEKLLLQTTNQQQKQHEVDMPDLEFAVQDTTLARDGEKGSFEQNAIRELEQLFFVYIHPSVNIIHQPRYLQSLNLGSELQPPIFLRHALCALAARASSSYSSLRESLYQSARKHLQEAEIKDQNFDKVTLAHAQTWIIIAVYELKNGFMHRSLMSISRAVRLVQLMRLHRVDGLNRISDPSLNLIVSPEDWTAAEERRRLFWFTFLMDRYAGISMGWPTLIDQRDIRTYLPASDDAYESSTEEPSMFLSEAAASPSGHRLLSSFAAQIVGVDMCCTRIQDLMRLDASTAPSDWTGNMWAKCSKIESLLSAIFHVPQHLSIPPAKLDPSNVFLSMGQAATIITVHRVAKFQAGKCPLSAESLEQSRIRCLEAATTIVRMMKLTSHWDLHIFHPCTSFCLYVAAMVYANEWKCHADSSNEEALRFMLDSLHSFKRTTRLAFNLLEDIEQEMPGLIAKLNGEEIGSVDSYKEFLNFDAPVSPESEVMFLSMCTNNAQQESGGTGKELEDTESASILYFDDVAAWTVDDPDIARVGKHL